MKEYFILQFRMTNRKLQEAGINPLLGYLLALISFVLLTEYIYYKTAFASYAALLICFSFLFALSEKSRSDFLLSTFGSQTKRTIRIFENSMICIPFVAVHIFKHDFIEAAILPLTSIIIASLGFHKPLNFFIPTPFSKHPYEFLVGFRKSFYLFPIAYLLTIIGIYVDNFNLGVFSMMLVYAISLGFYTKPEIEYYVWLHTDSPKRFILKKLMFATRNILILNTPILLALVIFYPHNWAMILLFFTIGLLFLWMVALIKYAVYPKEMNIPEAILFTLNIFFPPLLIATVPFFYFRSINNLKLYLNDTD